MKTRLLVLFLLIFLSMLSVSVLATMQRGIVEASRDLWPDLWFRATLLDAYCGFITFYVWVAYKERSWGMRTVWFVLIMSLGNFAMSSYVIWKLLSLQEFSWAALLLRDDDTTSDVEVAV